MDLRDVPVSDRLIMRDRRYCWVDRTQDPAVV